METTNYHIPVLLDEVLDALAIKPNGVYFDVTFGGGGHSQAILKQDSSVKVVGFDWDQNAIEHAEQFKEMYGERLQLVWGSFAHLYKLSRKHKLPKADAILADFGTSQFQINERDGFSVFNKTALDMRMSASHFKTTAADVVNFATEQELCHIFWEYGEERHAKKIVRKILDERRKKKLTTTTQLAKLIESVVPKKEKIHPATRVFQALRIFVNKELENITAFLPVAFDQLKPGGRLACISFHSLEDRMVKNFFREQVAAGRAVEVSKKPITASEEELIQNRSARSAKLRVIEKK